ncbi:MAG: C69 family dipeptidase [Ruminococcus sp.]|uniref:C69 family dipeptidase n=1 Tax=Ruminococcus sp. TaxID=41978 RepID=UPI0025EDE0C3|nr:C69 family dipeptidase [Ruminococcus sp.]MBO4866981.1 C69 family dipeptidase [Ruminococcus sp.]
MCTSILVGKNATTTGSTIIARNEDCASVVTPKLLFPMRSPFYTSLLENEWILGNGLKVPIPCKAFRYCSSPDAGGNIEKERNTDIGDHYFFEARGINEKGVAMTATNSMGINSRALECDPTVSGGIEESVITTLILPQIDSALNGVELLGAYVEKYGASEANGICFSDSNEVWYMEIGSGHHWIAVRVPDDSYLIVANSMRIHDVDLDDTQNIRYSEHIFEFVKEYGLLENPDRKCFNFSDAFGFQEKMDDISRPFYNCDRIWIAQHILNPNIRQEPRIIPAQYPLFMKPESKISLEMVEKVLCADYRGTELEGKADRPIGTVKTVESHIIEMNPAFSERTNGDIQGIIWQSIGTPLYSRYLCVIPELTEIPAAYHDGTNMYDKNNMFWRDQLMVSCFSVLGRETADNIREKIQTQNKDNFIRFYQIVESAGNDLTGALRQYSSQSLIDNIKESEILCNRLVSKLAEFNQDF